jgi:hypothetical protein
MTIDSDNSYRLSAIRGTPYPNRLLDFSVTLPETQLRILNLIVRNTLGWQSNTPGHRRACVLISLTQIKKKIGRSSMAPVIEALHALVKAEVISASTYDDHPLSAEALGKGRYRSLKLGIARSWVEET